MRKRFANPAPRPYRPTPFDLAPHIPTSREIELATRARRAFPAPNYSSYEEVHVCIDSSEGAFDVILPSSALALLYEILRHMEYRQGVTVLPCRSSLSTQEAADLLDMSRPHLVLLLEAGEIPFWKAGTHRRVLLQDVVDYRRRQQCEPGRKASSTPEKRALR